jgi:hypothetical protein
LQSCKTPINKELGEVDKGGCEMDSKPFFVRGFNENALFDVKSSKKGVYTEGV